MGVIAFYIIIGGLVLGSSFVYTLVYNKKINARLKDIQAEHKKMSVRMMSPLKFTLIVVLTLLFAYCILILAFKISQEKMKGSEKIVLDVESYSDEKIDGSMVSYFDAEKDIPGYTRKVTEKDDFRFVIYENSSHKRDFPEIIAYADYTGSRSASEYEYRYNYMAHAGVYPIVSGSERSFAEVNGVWFTIEAQNIKSEVYLSYAIKDEDGILAESRTLAVPVHYDVHDEDE